jgi:hypothetical protein
MKHLVLGLIFSLAAPQLAMAQVELAPASQPSVTLGSAPANKLYQGTEVSLRLLRELTTKGKVLKVGDRFDLELIDALIVGTETIIPAGSRAVGEIMSVRNKGMWGKSGKFNARLMYLRVGDRNIRLGGTFDDKGVAGGWGAGLTTALVFAPAGFFMTGTSAKVEAGSVIKGFLDEDVPFVVNK